MMTRTWTLCTKRFTWTWTCIRRITIWTGSTRTTKSRAGCRSFHHI